MVNDVKASREVSRYYIAKNTFVFDTKSSLTGILDRFQVVSTFR